MVRTFAAGLVASALLWTVGCSSKTETTPPEGEPAAAAPTGSTGDVAAASHTVVDPGSEFPAANGPAARPSASSSASDAALKGLSPTELVARGIRLSEKGNRRDALAAYTAALKQEPKNLSALLFKAGEEYALQELDAAEKDVALALKIDPNYAEAYVLRAHLWGMKHDYQRAVDDFYLSLQHPEREPNFRAYFGDKKDVVSHVYLAASFAECPDLNFRNDAKAFEHALLACQADEWQNRRYVSLLINAIAGAKTQDEALARQEQALAAAPTDSIKEMLQTAVEAFELRSEFPLR